MFRFSIKDKALTGILWSVSGTAGQSLFQLLVFIALARMLDPDVFGIVAIASALIDILNLVGRGGIVEVLVHRTEVKEQDLNAGFFASLLIGVVLTLMLYLTAPLLAYIFGVEQLDVVVRLLAPVCLLYAVGATYEAKLRREFQFRQLAVRNASATIVSGLVALAMAFGGFGVYALVAQRLISTAWSLASMGVASGWLPKSELDFREMLVQVKHGSAIAASSVLGAGNQRLIDLVVGYFLGPTQLGYLRIAWRILDLLVEIAVRPIANVTLTTLSKARADGRNLDEAYLKIVRWSSIVIIPAFLGFAATSKEVVAIIFGHKWDTSAELLSILSLVGIFAPLIYFKTNLLIASGRFRHVLYVNAIEFLLSIAIVSMFAPFGLIFATTGNVVRTAVATPVILFYLQKLLKVSAWRSIRACLPASISSFAMLGAIYFAKRSLPNITEPYADVVLYVAIGVVTYTVMIILTDRNLISDLKARKKLF